MTQRLRAGVHVAPFRQDIHTYALCAHWPAGGDVQVLRFKNRRIAELATDPPTSARYTYTYPHSLTHPSQLSHHSLCL